MPNLEIFDTKTIDEALPLLSEQRTGRQVFDHFDARTVDSAVTLLSRYPGEAKIIAGGVDMVGLMRRRLSIPRVLVNIKAIPDLTYIAEDAEGLKIGALTIIRDIETSALIREKYRILAEAAHSVGSPLVRNMATMAGNLCQQVRCWYYRHSSSGCPTFFCRRKGGEQCFAADGENKYHAIIGGGECHAVCPSDMAPALIALGARVKIASPTGDRTVPLEEFYTPLWNMLAPDEIITEIQVPVLQPGTRQRYLKFRERGAIDFAISSVATVIATDAGVVSRAKIVLGGVAPTPYRAIGAEQIIEGEEITEGIVETTARAAVSQAIPLSQNAYKVPITEALVRRAILG